MYHNRVYVPETLRTSVLKQLHQGHPGIYGMKTIARTLVWYPGIDQDITDCNFLQKLYRWTVTLAK